MHAFAPVSRFQVNSAGIHHCQPDWRMRLGPLNDFDLWVAFAGRGWIEVGEEMCDVRTGDAFLLHPGGQHPGWHDPERPLYVIAVHFDIPDTSARQEVLARGRRFHLDAPQLLEDLLQRTAYAWQDNLPAVAGGWLQAAVQEVLDHPAGPRPGPPPAHAAVIAGLCDRIRHHPERDWAVDSLAADLGVTPDHFTRLFRRHRGETPRSFIIRHRIAAATQLLTGSEHSIRRIAEILGYRTVQYFCRQFRDRVGKSPGRYRREGR